VRDERHEEPGRVRVSVRNNAVLRLHVRDNKPVAIPAPASR
jgi:hypothetical protein